MAGLILSCVWGSGVYDSSSDGSSQSLRRTVKETEVPRVMYPKKTLSQLGFYCWDETTRPKAIWSGKRFVSAYNSQVMFHHRGKSGQELQLRTWRQEPKQKPWRDIAYWLALHSLHALCSYATLGHKHGGGTSHRELGPLHTSH